MPRTPGFRRSGALAVTAGLHGLLAPVSSWALRGFPRARDIPVLRVSGVGPEARQCLEAALDLLETFSPGLLRRLQRHVVSLFLIRRPRAHGHYSRITGSCTLDVDALTRNSPAQMAAALVRCATEASLWRSGRGRTTEDEMRIMAISERARRQFLERAGPVPGAAI